MPEATRPVAMSGKNYAAEGAAIDQVGAVDVGNATPAIARRGRNHRASQGVGA